MQRLCVYIDATDLSWSGIVTQIPINHASRSHKEQKHVPFLFLLGRFDTTQLRWSTLEKEAFAVMNIHDRMYWIFCTPDGQ